MGSGRGGRNQVSGTLLFPDARWPQWGPAVEAGISDTYLPANAGEIPPQWGPAVEAGISALTVLWCPAVISRPQWGPAVEAGISHDAWELYGPPTRPPQWGPAVEAGISSGSPGGPCSPR